MNISEVYPKRNSIVLVMENHVYTSNNFIIWCDVTKIYTVPL